MFERRFVGDGMTNFVWQELREAPWFSTVQSCPAKIKLQQLKKQKCWDPWLKLQEKRKKELREASKLCLPFLGSSPNRNGKLLILLRVEVKRSDVKGNLT